VSNARARRVGERAAAWLSAQEPEFARHVGPRDTRPFRRCKRLGELAQAGEILGRRRDPRAQPLLRFAWDALDGGDELEWLIRQHPDLVMYATLYPPFFRRGLRHRPLEQTIARQARRARLRDPVLRFYTACALGAIGLASPWSARELVRATWLYRAPAGAIPTRPAGYEITHTIFFLTDYGRRPSAVPAQARKRLIAELPRMLAHTCGRDDVDLAGELALAARCLEQPLPAAALRLVEAAQQPDGMVRARSRSPSGATARDRFLRNYHATIVATILGVLG
jgi:hypothetical protein